MPSCSHFAHRLDGPLVIRKLYRSGFLPAKGLINVPDVRLKIFPNFNLTDFGVDKNEMKSL